MSEKKDTDFFPGFQEDSHEKSKDHAHGKPSTGAHAPKVFEAELDLDAAMYGGATESPKPDAKTPPKKPSQGKMPAQGAPKPKAPAAPHAPIVDAPVEDALSDNEDAKGRRKDLWNCPHCGAGNQPKRTECRMCGKKPTDRVVPWYEKNAKMLISGLAVALVVAALVFWLMKPSMSFKTPSLKNISNSISLGTGGTSSTTDLGEFVSEGKLSICGRLVRFEAASAERGPRVLLAMGPNARDTSMKLKVVEDRVMATTEMSPEGFAIDSALIEIVGFSGEKSELAGLKPGMVVSVTGTFGTIGNRNSSQEKSSFLVIADRFGAENP
jgi:ribosomal protein L40E